MTRKMFTEASRTEEAQARIVEPLQRVEAEARIQEQDEHRRDDHVHRRTGERHDDLLARIFRHALKAGEPANRKQRDVRRADAVAARGERVAELMRHDAGEKRQDEGHALDRCLRAALLVVRDRDPGEKQEERDVDADFRAEQPADREGPGHFLTRLRGVSPPKVCRAEWHSMIDRKEEGT